MRNDPPAATLGGLNENAQALGVAAGAGMQSLAGLNLGADALGRIQADYVAQAAALWNESLARLGKDGKGAPPVGDRRFAGDAWTGNPVAAIAAQTYLLNARTLLQLAESVQGDAKARARVRFAVQQWVDSVSPANFLALNPDALAKITSRFSEKESTFWNSALQIVSFSQVREVAFRPWATQTIPRRFCTGKVLVSDGVERRVNYSIGEDTGIIGATWGVEWCVVGLDRNWAYSPACRMALP